MIYIKRHMEDLVLKLSNQYPVIMVCGQNETGKSTMLKHIAQKDRKYVSFDDAKVRNLAKNDPELFFETYGTKLIIDEFQRVPEILLEIKKIVDERIYTDNEPNGIFWLSGSQKFVMMKNVSETLAGRVAILNLLPLSQREINGLDNEMFSPYVDDLKNKKSINLTQSELFEKIFKGGMPKIVSNDNIDRDFYYSSYINTYIERDVSTLEKVGKLDDFRNFVTYMAANTGQELKYDTISKVIGVSAPTIKEWITILDRSGIIFILRPYHNSLSKRLVKIPKCYFIDTGLAAYLTSWPTPKTLENGASSGAFFETYVISEILKSYYNNGKEPNFYYYRDSDQKEIDLLIVEGDKIYPIEIKKNKNPANPNKNLSALNKFNMKVMPEIVLCMADEFIPFNKECYLCPITKI